MVNWSTICSTSHASPAAPLSFCSGPNLAGVAADALETSRPLLDARKHRLVVAMPGGRCCFGTGPSGAGGVEELARLIPPDTRPEGGEIHGGVRAAGRSGQKVVRVCDNGIGIPAEMLPDVFDTATQVPEPSPVSQGSLGIGLTLVRNLVEMQGGRVEAASSGRGKMRVCRSSAAGRREATARKATRPMRGRAIRKRQSPGAGGG